LGASLSRGGGVCLGCTRRSGAVVERRGAGCVGGGVDVLCRAT